MPQQGTLLVTTEMGRLLVEPLEIVVIPQGIRFAVGTTGVNIGDGAAATATTTQCRGYILEVFGSHFQLPELGPIGANGGGRRERGEFIEIFVHSLNYKARPTQS